MKLKTRKEKFYEAKLFIGSRRGYDGPTFSQWELNQAICDFQKSNEQGACSVRITPTTFQFGTYVEGGWEVAAVKYPRFPVAECVIRSFIIALAGHLIEKFGQNRISVTTPEEVILLEREDAEDGPNSSR